MSPRGLENSGRSGSAVVGRWLRGRGQICRYAPCRKYTVDTLFSSDFQFRGFWVRPNCADLKVLDALRPDLDYAPNGFEQHEGILEAQSCILDWDEPFQQVELELHVREWGLSS